MSVFFVIQHHMRFVSFCLCAFVVTFTDVFDGSREHKVVGMERFNELGLKMNELKHRVE